MNNIPQIFARWISQGNIKFPNNQYWNNAGVGVGNGWVLCELNCELGFSIKTDIDCQIKINDENNGVIDITPGGLRYIANSTSRIYIRSKDIRLVVNVEIWSNIDLTSQLTCDRLETIIDGLDSLNDLLTVFIGGGMQDLYLGIGNNQFRFHFVAGIPNEMHYQRFDVGLNAWVDIFSSLQTASSLILDDGTYTNTKTAQDDIITDGTGSTTTRLNIIKMDSGTGNVSSIDFNEHRINNATNSNVKTIFDDTITDGTSTAKTEINKITFNDATFSTHVGMDGFFMIQDTTVNIAARILAGSITEGCQVYDVTLHEAQYYNGTNMVPMHA
jgi:hypothetical protein